MSVLHILLVADNQGDVLLVKEALRAHRIEHKLEGVKAVLQERVVTPCAPPNVPPAGSTARQYR